jgi:hypothetical protein
VLQLAYQHSGYARLSCPQHSKDKGGAEARLTSSSWSPTTTLTESDDTGLEEVRCQMESLGGPFQALTLRRRMCREELPCVVREACLLLYVDEIAVTTHRTHFQKVGPRFFATQA